MASLAKKTSQSEGFAFLSVLHSIIVLCILLVAPAHSFTWPEEYFAPTSGSAEYERLLDSINSDSCHPTPCGPNTVCLVDRKNSGAICECRSGFHFHTPYPEIGCWPDCASHEDCPHSTYACNVQNKCVNPCKRDDGSSFCGTDADCKVKNNKAICSCPLGYMGDPNIRCYIDTVELAWRKNNKIGGLSYVARRAQE